MNSKQRRHTRRKYPHQVEIKARTTEQYLYHDVRVDDGHAWCRQHVKKGQWQYTELWDHAIFYFASQKDATYFALKWS
jgi:hypothetical protein